MQVNSSQAETQIATLLAGLTTNIMNHIANLEEELKATRQIAADLQKSVKEREAEIERLECELTEAKSTITEMQEK